MTSEAMDKFPDFFVRTRIFFWPSFRLESALKYGSPKAVKN